MALTPSPILLCTSRALGTEDVRGILEQAGHAVASVPLEHQAGANPTTAQLIVVDGSQDHDQALTCCRLLRARQGEQYVPILYMTPDASPAMRRACLEAGADAYLLRPFDPAELLAQTQALLRIKEHHDGLAAKSAEVNRINKRLQTAYQQIDQELELARHIQQSFLPRSLPELPGVRFAAHYQPQGRVGGDFYDVSRLDEHHTGFYVADAMGHGVPASLLTIFVKTGVRAKEITGRNYRLVPPDEVLHNLNSELIRHALSDHPFITMVYALFNHRDGILQFSRSGHPYPLYLPRQGPPQLWTMEGSLLGVFETQYHLRTQTLKPGDKVLLYTDGMDAAAFDGQPVGIPSLLAAAERFGHLPIQELIDHLAGLLFQQTKPADDLTMVGLESVPE